MKNDKAVRLFFVFIFICNSVLSFSDTPVPGHLVTVQSKLPGNEEGFTFGFIIAQYNNTLYIIAPLKPGEYLFSDLREADITISFFQQDNVIAELVNFSSDLNTALLKCPCPDFFQWMPKTIKNITEGKIRIDFYGLDENQEFREISGELTVLEEYPNMNIEPEEPIAEFWTVIGGPVYTSRYDLIGIIQYHPNFNRLIAININEITRIVFDQWLSLDFPEDPLYSYVRIHGSGGIINDLFYFQNTNEQGFLNKEINYIHYSIGGGLQVSLRKFCFFAGEYTFTHIKGENISNPFHTFSLLWLIHSNPSLPEADFRYLYPYIGASYLRISPQVLVENTWNPIDDVDKNAAQILLGCEVVFFTPFKSLLQLVVDIRLGLAFTPYIFYFSEIEEENDRMIDLYMTLNFKIGYIFRLYGKRKINRIE